MCARSLGFAGIELVVGSNRGRFQARDSGNPGRAGSLDRHRRNVAVAGTDRAGGIPGAPGAPIRRSGLGAVRRTAASAWAAGHSEERAGDDL